MRPSLILFHSLILSISVALPRSRTSSKNFLYSISRFCIVFFVCFSLFLPLASLKRACMFVWVYLCAENYCLCVSARERTLTANTNRKKKCKGMSVALWLECISMSSCWLLSHVIFASILLYCDSFSCMYYVPVWLVCIRYTLCTIYRYTPSQRPDDRNEERKKISTFYFFSFLFLLLLLLLLCHLPICFRLKLLCVTMYRDHYIAITIKKNVCEYIMSCTPFSLYRSLQLSSTRNQSERNFQRFHIHAIACRVIQCCEALMQVQKEAATTQQHVDGLEEVKDEEIKR